MARTTEWGVLLRSDDHDSRHGSIARHREDADAADSGELPEDGSPALVKNPPTICARPLLLPPDHQHSAVRHPPPLTPCGRFINPTTTEAKQAPHMTIVIFHTRHLGA